MYLFFGGTVGTLLTCRNPVVTVGGNSQLTRFDVLNEVPYIPVHVWLPRLLLPIWVFNAVFVVC